MTQRRLTLGASGESAARQALEAGGLSFVAANVRCPYGEIDLVMRDGKQLVFVEVKTRKGKMQGVPQEAVTARKLKHLVDTAMWYCRERGVTEAWQIDVVAIGPDGIEHIPNITA